MSPEIPACPKCGAHHFKIWKLPNPLLLHWVINPGLAFNELVLGQRVPCESFECLSCDLPRNERGFAFCRACGTLHDSRIWQGKQGFGNWLGLVCPSCGERIPCLWNLLSLAILAVTAPLWWVLVRLYRRRVQPVRPTLDQLNTPGPTAQQSFLRMAVFYGCVMFAGMTLVPAIRRASQTGKMDWLGLGFDS